MNIKICNWNNVRFRQFKLRVKFFLPVLHDLIERWLLITKISFLALANASFRSKNTKYCERVVFRSRKTQLFRNVQNLLLRSFFQLLKIIYPDSESKAEYKQVVESIPDQGGKARLRYFKIFLKYGGVRSKYWWLRGSRGSTKGVRGEYKGVWEVRESRFFPLAPDPKLHWGWRFESHWVHYVQVDFVNLSSFST